jgi:hypothetical protein
MQKTVLTSGAIVLGLLIGLLVGSTWASRAAAQTALHGLNSIGNDAPASGCDIYTHVNPGAPPSASPLVITVCGSGFSAAVR